MFIAPDVQFSTIREPEVVILDSDPYGRVYNDLPTEHLVLRKVPICEYCGAIRFLGEGPSFCCRQGKVNIVNTPVPDDLQRLFTSQTDRDTLYFKKIFGISTLISLSQALELPWIIGSLLQLVTISCRNTFGVYAHCYLCFINSNKELTLIIYVYM